MKIKDLIKELQQYPEDMDVVIEKNNTDFAYSEIESVDKRNVGFSEDSDSKPLCDAKCIVISDVF